MMEHSENDVGGKRSDPFIDRSKVRILLCDNDEKSTEEVFDLLCKCSYQVTSVRSARQVIDALNAEGPDIDIILSEVDLPMKKGMKMLKYIMTDKELQRIPVIMMSTQDEVSIVVKCLRLGAADYLVKPLRTNELLNLWTHMWRRRRMLGLAEKNILSYDFDMVASDPSDANTNSTTLFSDDTDDKSRRSGNPEMGMPSQQDDETYEAAMEPGLPGFLDCRPDVPGISDRKTGQLPSCPKKSELKIGESSAFFTYVKSSVVKNNVQASITPDENAPQPPRTEEKSKPYANGNTRYDNGEASENNSPGEEFPSSTSVPDSTSLERSCTPPVPFELVQSRLNDEGMSQLHMNHRNGTHLDISGFGPDACFPYYMAGAMNRVMIPSSSTNAQNHPTSGMIHHYNHLQPCSSYVPGMASFPYYPFGICLPPGQMPNTHQWPAFGSSSSSDAKTIKVDRREAALMKFRQKRKERCFDKKIRYVNRKKLAERRPRVHGQFVRKMNGVTVDLNGEPSLTGLEEEEDEEDDDDPASQDLSPEDAAS